MWKLGPLFAISTLLASTASWAEIPVPAGSNLFEIVKDAPSGETLVLQGSEFPQSIEVIGKTLTVQGAQGGTSVGGPNGTSMLYLDQGSDVTLNDINFSWTDPERAGIFVDGGTLRMTGGSLAGDLRFAIYATAGASIYIDDVKFSGMNNGIYLLDSGQISVTKADFADLYGSSISGFGAPITADLQNVTVATAETNADVSAVVFREGPQVSIQQSTILGPNANGIYVDDGTQLSMDDVVIEGAAIGVLALNTGSIEVQNSTIDGFTAQGLVVEGASDIRVVGMQIEGNGQAIGLRGQTSNASFDTMVLANSDPEFPTFFINTTGAFSIKNTSASGGYAALYVQGAGQGARSIELSDFSQAVFAAGVLQQAGPAEGEQPIFIQGSFFQAKGEAVGLALDRTSHVSIGTSAIMATDGPALSVYEEGTIDAEKTIIASGGPDAWLGALSHTFDTPSRANVIATEIDFANQTVAEVFAALQTQRNNATESAKGTGQVIAVNKQGMQLFGEAAQVVLTAANGNTYPISAQGTATEVPSGQYQLAVDGIAQSPIDVTAGQLIEIEIPDSSHPYFLFQSDNQFYRGAAIPLLPRDQIRKNYAARSVIHDQTTFWNKDIYGPTRTALTASDLETALVEARALFFANFAAAHAAYEANNYTPEANPPKHVMNYSAGVLAALGTVQDRDQILTMLPAAPSYARTVAIEVATLIEARLDLVAESAALNLARDVQVENPNLTIELAAHLGALGNRSATPLILDAMEQTNYAPNDFQFSSKQLVFNLLARSNDPRILSFFRKTLADYQAMTAALPTGSQIKYSSPDGFSYYMLPMVIEYLAVFGNDQDWANAAIPVAGVFGFHDSIAALVQDPLPLYFDRIGMSPRPSPAYMHPSDVSGYGRLICSSLERRSKADRDRILNTLIETTGPRLNDEYYGLPEARAWIVGEAVTQVTSAYCNPNTRIAGAFHRRPLDLEVFPIGDKALSWGSRRALADHAIQAFSPNDNWTDMRQMSNISVEDLAAVTAGDPRFATEAGRAMLLHHRVIDLRYQEATPDHYPSGTERRLFLTPLAESRGEAILNGRVDLRPIIQNGRLLVGLRLRVAYDENGFLSPQMSGRDVSIPEALANGARNLIKEVRMRVGDTVTPMTFQQSAAGNVHVFAVPLPDTGLADLTVDVELETFNEKWDLQFPLYATDFAYRYRKGQL